MSKILVIDDESAILENLKFVLELDNHEVITAASGEEGITLFKENIDLIDAVVTDMKMPKVSGMDVLKEIKTIMPEMSIIVLTGHGDMENAILAMKEGAFDFLLKPVNVDMLTIALKNAISKKILLVDNKRLEKELLAKNKYLQNIHDSAERILLNMLPKRLPQIEGFNFISKYKSCDVVGGDMYDVIDTSRYVFFYVFDVSSHGILASVITIILKSFLQNLKYNYSNYISPSDFEKQIFELNTVLHLNTSQEVFATLFIGVIDKHTKIMHYISAGHIKQILFNKSDLKTLNSTGTILGVFEGTEFISKKIKLSRGDKIVMFTDGLIEVTNSNEMYGSDRLFNFLKNIKHEKISTIIDLIINEIQNYSNEKQSDDTTILGIELI